MAWPAAIRARGSDPPGVWYHATHVERTYLSPRASGQIVARLTALLLPLPDAIIGVVCPSQSPASLGWVPTLIALMGARRTHCPLDPDPPSPTRQLEALRDLGIRTIVGHPEWARQCPGPATIWARLPADLVLMRLDSPPGPVWPPAWASDLERADVAYVIQTSGTTGRRKSVCVSWASIEANVRDFHRLFPLASVADSVLSLSPPTFDPFYLEILLAVLAHRPIHFVSHRIKLNAVMFSQVIQRHRIAFIQLTPSLFELVKSGPAFGAQSTLKYVVLGGEPFPKAIPSPAPAHLRYFNAYGVTEMSCWQSLIEVQPGSSSCPPPIWTSTGNLLSDTHVSLTSQGEIVVSSATRICRVHPGQGTQHTEKGYSVFTGDLGEAQCTGDGQQAILFHTRCQNFVKLQGRRISFPELAQDLSQALGCPFHCVLKEDRRVLGFHSQDIDPSRLSHLPPILRGVELVKVPRFPITRHGKIDLKLLLEWKEETHRKKVGLNVAKLWRQLTGIDPVVDSNFVRDGGDSILAVEFINEIEDATNNPSVQSLLELLLNGQFGEFQDQIMARIGDSSILAQSRVKEHHLNSCSDMDISRTPLDRSADHTQISILGRGFRRGPIRSTIDIGSTDLKVLWSVDLNKCIDATPLIVKDKEDTVIFIGSHSGLFAAIHMDSGRTRWTRNLGDRIESSANCSPDGRLIFIGCYDCAMYCLDARSGDILWSFKTGGIIKSIPAVDGERVIFGSYDHFVYCLNSITGTLLWAKNIARSSILTKALTLVDGSVIACTLSGHVSKRDTQEGANMWTTQLDGPIFSSPLCIGTWGYFATAKGLLSKLCLASSELVWTFDAQGPIFSSLVPSGSDILLGTHACEVLCVDSTSGLCRWRVKHTDRVFATPLLTSSQMCVSLSTDGQIIVSKDGAIVKMVYFPVKDRLQGGFFSSPLAHNGQVIICSRDNRVHCVRL